MPDLIYSLNDIEVFLADLLSELTGLDSKKVLIQHSEFGQVSSKINEDVCYVNVDSVNDYREIFKNREKEYNASTETFTFSQQGTRTLRASFIFYGPNASKLAFVFNERMYFSSTKLNLANNNLFLVPESSKGPVTLHEVINARWWKRCDLTLDFYNPIVVEEEVNSFKEFDIRTEVN